MFSNEIDVTRYLSKFHVIFEDNEVMTKPSTFHCIKVRNSKIFLVLLLSYSSGEPTALQV